jgi:hypothetical protein
VRLNGNPIGGGVGRRWPFVKRLRGGGGRLGDFRKLVLPHFRVRSGPKVAGGGLPVRATRVARGIPSPTPISGAFSGPESVSRPSHR